MKVTGKYHPSGRPHRSGYFSGVSSIFVACFLIALQPLYAQVGFNKPTPNPASIIDLTANDKGLLIPRMSSIERQALASFISGMNATEKAEVESLMLFDKDEKRFYYYSAGTWFVLNEWAKTAGSNDVSLTGNATINGQLSVNGNANVTGQLAMNGSRITNVASGSSAGDAVNKTQLDTKADKSITVTGINALTGGGDLSGSRTLDVASLGITTNRIADEAVTTAKVANGAITSDKIDKTVMASMAVGGSDWNSMDKSGLYLNYTTSVLNNGPPLLNTTFMVIVMQYSFTPIKQLAIAVTNSAAGNIYYREFTSGAWTTWANINN
jgi:hypothetical protein